jgi:hypothetical protein
MSTYEKIASAVIGVLVLAMLVFSYHEITEPKGSDHEQGPNFQQSLGGGFKMGTFATILSQQSSGSLEANCKPLEPVIVGTLHDIDEHLEQLDVYKPGVFEVNQQTLDLLCYQNASLTLSDEQGDKLLLVKLPFQRETPPGGSPDDIGTDVRINATVILPGTVPPAIPTTYGEELIPDKYLDTTSGK